jgi:hypothetical protein
MKVETPAADTRAYLLRCRAALMTQPTPANLAKVAAFDTVLQYVEVGVEIEAETALAIKRVMQIA